MSNPTLSNTHRAVRDLRAMIFSGALPAGSDHLETELARKLNMSRTPVREAVLTLESQGLLEMRPRKGVRILPLSPDDMAEIYDILTELESHAAESAASMGYTDQELLDLASAIDAMEEALAQSDLEAWAKADEHFHTELVRLGGNLRIKSIVTMMQDQVRRARMTTLYLRPLPRQSNEDHRLVFTAILNGNAKAARQIHRSHRQQAKTVLVDLLAKLKLRYL